MLKKVSCFGVTRQVLTLPNMLMILLFLITAQICGKMRTNGILRYQIISETGFNDDGEPIASGSWSEEIPCSIKTVTNNSKGR